MNFLKFVLNGKETKSAITIPVIIGSGATKENINNYLAADAFIVGSDFKKHGR